jgi:NADPH:quinone reductase-like Zn-dependent oxidoreductase
MKAVVYTRYGSPDVLQFEEVEKPLPKDHQVLIKVHAASVNALDRHGVKSTPALARLVTGSGLRKPKDHRLGVDVAGRVEAVGSTVTQFQPGDEVFGLGVGTFAEYACAREDAVVAKPATMTFEVAAALPVAALTALQGLRDKGQIQPGEQVLIQGASGGVGSFAVQIAKALGAEVTAVCSTGKMELVRSLGADHIIDYTKEDSTRNGKRYDLILAVNGYHSILAYRRALRPEGRYVMAGEGSNTHLFPAVLQTMLLGRVISRLGRQKMTFFIADANQKDLGFLAELTEAGKVVPVIDACYPLDETAQAFWYLEEGHAKGKVVISVEQTNHAY